MHVLLMMLTRGAQADGTSATNGMAVAGEEVTVSGSHITADGYQSSTQLMVLGANDINAEAPSELGQIQQCLCSVLHGCPLSTVYNTMINDNHISGAIYFDVSVAHDFMTYGVGTEAFSGSTYRHTPPAIDAEGPAGSAYGDFSANPAEYDVVGRMSAGPTFPHRMRVHEPRMFVI